MPFELHIGVAGKAVPGPSYVEQAASSAASPSESPTGAPSASDSASPSIDASSASDDQGPGIGVYLGALGVLALLGAGYLAYRSRAATPD